VQNMSRCILQWSAGCDKAVVDLSSDNLA